jgi:transcriptional regulator with XRE-family HTH domain
MNIKDTIGARIRELRKAQKLSQEYLAFLCDLDRTYIGSVENGKRNISIENIEKIARALNISLRDFFDHESFALSENTKSNPPQSTPRVQTPDRNSHTARRRTRKK